MSSKAFAPKIKLEHIVTFSDAVFAFALTLMALTVDIPDLELSLTEQQLTKKPDLDKQLKCVTLLYD